MTKTGAWAGFVVGLGITVPLMVLNAIGGILDKWMTPPAIGAMAMIASLIITPVVSVLSKKFSAEHVESVFGSAEASAEGSAAEA
jgi:Na+(H+)/acetate symporter ActP